MTDKQLAKLIARQNKVWHRLLVVLEQMEDNAQRNLDTLNAVTKGLK